jgi:putative ABC transport system substrate-binding protein
MPFLKLGGGVRRREFIALAGGAAAAHWPIAVQAAEPGKLYRIALSDPALPISEMTETGDHPGWVALLKEFRRLGYVEGKNLILLRFSGGGDSARFDSLVRDVVSAAPDLIFTSSSRLVLVYKTATSTIPVVGNMGDPVAFGIVTNIAHPDGNITGVASDAGEEIWGKRLAILLEAVPAATRIGCIMSEALWNGSQGALIRKAAQHFSISIVGSRLRGLVSETEYQRVFATLGQEQAQGLVVWDQPENVMQRRLIIELAESNRLPAIYPFTEFARLGGLLAYGDDLENRWGRMAFYADLILKGAKPSELPIELVTKFQMVINLKAVKALSLTLPLTLLAQADQVIE